MDKIIRCIECGNELSAFAIGKCRSCGADISYGVRALIREHKKFDLVRSLVCRPDRQWKDQTHYYFTYPPAEDAVAEAEAILLVLYGGVKDE